MPSLSALGEVPLGALGGDSGAPADTDLSSGAGCFDDPLAIFLNVLESVGAAIFPSGEALIANALDAGASIGAGGVGNVRFLAVASDAALLTLDNASQILSVLKDRIAAASGFDCLGRFRSNATAGARFQDSVAAAWAMLLADAGDAGDTQESVVRKLIGVADTLLALGNVQGRMSAISAVAVAAALEARVSAGWSVAAVDQAALADEARATMAAMLGLTDTAAGADEAAPALRLVLLTGDTATVADDPAAMLRAFSDLGDGATLFCTLRLGGYDYQGWALNTDLRAVTEYRNVPFDSFAVLDGVTYAASEDGIYQLGGDTDDGAPIDAWIRPFLVDFGTHKMKQVTDIWVGTSSTGLAAKVRMKDPKTGTTYDVVYPVQYNHGAGTDKGRVEVGRGLVSQWWGLTISNVDGADFDVETIEWRALVLDRRQ